jgi:hypothetical protein
MASAEDVVVVAVDVADSTADVGAAGDSREWLADACTAGSMEESAKRDAGHEGDGALAAASRRS